MFIGINSVNTSQFPPFSSLTGLRPLHLAAWAGHVGVVRELLSRDADFKARGREGRWEPGVWEPRILAPTWEMSPLSVLYQFVFTCMHARAVQKLLSFQIQTCFTEVFLDFR